MRPRDPADLLLVGVGSATATLLALTEQYPSVLAGAAAYAVTWWLLRPADTPGRHLPFH